MNVEEFYSQTKAKLESKLHFLEDKPDETVDSTLKACWQTALGFPMSAKEALNHRLKILTEEQIIILNDLIEKRLNNVPLAYLTGRQNFMGVELLADERALIPRKETEILGKKALEISYEIIKHKEKVQVIDVCCGSGNLGLALAYFNQSVIVDSTDMSEEAVKLTRDNISFLNLQERVRVYSGDLFSAFKDLRYFESADLIVCNPPYISSAKVSKMNIEISAHEPSLAFDGGIFGFKILQRLIEEAPKYLTKSGWLVFEVGVGQGDFSIRLCKNVNTYIKIESVQDDLGNIRVISVKKG